MSAMAENGGRDPGGDRAAGREAQEDPRPTLIYCRESRDENGEHYERIETQRDVLKSFCKKRGLTNVVDIVMDDNCSGTAFQRMEGILRRVKRGEVKVIVFKDSSRLGRNLKESLSFVELVEEHGGEILFESEDYNEDFFPLQAWFNERRAREDSLKIRRILTHKMETGTLLVKPHYGYRRGTAECIMVPEEETAAVVRWIFRQSAGGRTPGEIARMLNEHHIPTPSRHSGGERSSELWNSQHIRRILGNEVYLGTMIHHKTSRKSYKNKHILYHPKEEWIVLEDHHEPLVSRELFAQASRRGKGRPAVSPHQRPFSRLLRCGRCGSLLVRRAKKGRDAVYICGKNHREGALRQGGGCRPHSLREEELLETALSFLRQWLKGASVDPVALSDRSKQERQGGEDPAVVERKLRRVRARLDDLYEDLCRGILREEGYFRLRERFEREEAELVRRIGKIQEKNRREGAERLTEVDLSDIINHLETRDLTPEVVRMAFSGALVFEPEELEEARADTLGLSETQRKEIQRFGGVVFQTAALLPQHVASPQHIPAGWL